MVGSLTNYSVGTALRSAMLESCNAVTDGLLRNRAEHISGGAGQIMLCQRNTALRNSVGARNNGGCWNDGFSTSFIKSFGLSKRCWYLFLVDGDDWPCTANHHHQ